MDGDRLSMKRPSVDVVVVEWCSHERLRRCLAALAGSDRATVRLRGVTVVDNSGPGSRPFAHSTFPFHADLSARTIAPPANIGFAGACNLGAAGSDADFILFLNPDTSVHPDTIGRLVRFAERPENCDVGVLGPQLLAADGGVQRSCSRFPTTARLAGQILGLPRITGDRICAPFMTDWDHAHTRDVDQIQGACLMVRTAAFRAVGGFDPRFFLYFEDVDLCRRMAEAGWRRVFVAGATARHGGGGSTAQVVGFRTFHLARSRILYARIHAGAAAALALAALSILAEPALRLAQALLRGDGAAAGAVLDFALRQWRHILIERSRREADPAVPL